MQYRKLIKKLLFPPFLLICLLTLFSAVALTAVFVMKKEQTVFAYLTYAVAFYTLTLLCVFFCRGFPKRMHAWKQALHGKPLAHRFLTDASFRTHVMLYVTFAFNVLYVGMHLFSYAQNRSAWFLVLAVYYTILALMRFLLTRRPPSRRSEANRAILCASILLTVNLVLSGAVLMILYVGKGYVYHGLLIYVMAAYAFYMTSQAIVGLVRFRKSKSPLLKVAKVVSLSASLVSMLALETAMLSQFGQDMPVADKRLLIALTGAGVSITVITLAIRTIVRSAKERKLTEE